MRYSGGVDNIVGSDGADQPRTARGSGFGFSGGAPTDIPSALAGASIVVVDDQESNVVLLDRLLRSAGATQVHLVTDARHAVRRCLEVGADLVLLDLHMPHLGGVEVLEQLRAVLEPDAYVPVLVLTADTTDAAKGQALAAGAKDFLTKPLDREDVVLRVRNHLETVLLYRRVRQENLRLQSELDERERVARETQARLEATRRAVHDVLDRNLVEMVFQPVVDLADGRVVAVEALARFRTPERRPPDEWFAAAAAVGLQTELEVAAIAAALRRLPDLPPSVLLNVNVSPRVAMTEAFAQCVADTPSGRLVVELTEHVPVDDYEALVHCLAGFRAAGVLVAVDDAGAGYAGLQHLVSLCPEVLKLDRELTLDIDQDPARRAMAASMVHFAEEIGAVLVAEGIETQGALDTLRQLGITLGQGYHLARPGLLPLVSDRIDLHRTSAAGGAGER